MRLNASLRMLVAVLVLIASTAGAGRAGVIDTTPSWDGSASFLAFGNGPDNTATLGQVVTAPTNILQSFTFYMKQSPFTFAGYVYAWDGSKATGPELWHSSPVQTSDPNVFQAITFSFSPGISVTPGAQYVIFASVSKNYTGNDSDGGGKWGMVWNGATPQTYAVFDNDYGNASLWTTAPWDSTQWWGKSDALAVKVEFGNTPSTGWNLVSLSPGWNLVSLPLQPPITSLTSALSGIKGAFEVVWAYPNQTWQVYDPNDTAGTLTTIQAGMGYWIKMTSAKHSQSRESSGSAPPSSLALLPGWNLVGYSGTSCVPPLATFSSIWANLQVSWGYPSHGWQFYDPANSASTLADICPGAGYWINVNQATTWSGW